MSIFLTRGNDRCEDGTRMRHSRSWDDPYGEVEAGVCPLCNGIGCAEFYRVVEMAERVAALNPIPVSIPTVQPTDG